MRVAYVRVSEFFWNRGAFFERICTQLSHPRSVLRSVYPRHSLETGMISLPKNRSAQSRVHTTAVFIEKLKDIFLPLNPPERACIFIEDADKLDTKVFGENILTIFLRLEELVRSLGSLFRAL